MRLLVYPLLAVLARSVAAVPTRSLDRSSHNRDTSRHLQQHDKPPDPSENGSNGNIIMGSTSSVEGENRGEIANQNYVRRSASADQATAQAVQFDNTTIVPGTYRTRPPTKEELEAERKARKLRMRERRERVREKLRNMPPPPPDQLQSLSKEELQKFEETRKSRGLSWFSNGVSDSYTSGILADPAEYYDKWQQAYRMLGGYVDCDHDKDDDDHDSHDDNDNRNNGDGSGGACSRWMVWACYVDPNYQGNEYYEYFGDSPTGTLDCHEPGTEWQLLGVYRQEFYQFIEQISKHLWAIDEYEYVVALAGLDYMSDYECFNVGYDNSGNSIYASVAPKPYGKFEMGLYTDGGQCLTPDDSLGMTYDDYGLQTEIDLGSKDKTDDDGYYWAYDWWYDTQEYTLTNLNEVYEEYKYCTSCVDYPTYQDGYFIGDYGTDDDDLINQCWKFHSHDSFTCESDCLTLAHAQGTILSVEYGDTTFGSTPSSFYQRDNSATQGLSLSQDSPLTRLLANAFLTLSFLLFVATFLAFAVARRSRYRESRSTRSRRLLDDDDGRSRKSRRSNARSDGGDGEGDGLFRSSTSRRKSSDKKSRKSSKSRKGDKSKKSRRSKSYEPPKESTSSRSRSAGPSEEYF